jgi:ribosomal protein L37E
MGYITMPEVIKKRKKLRKHWYFIDYDECPVCGRGKAYRTRMYNPKPKLQKNRSSWNVAYDWCDY